MPDFKVTARRVTLPPRFVAAPSVMVYSCAFCGAPDSRQPDHARGCPALAPVSHERLFALALDVEAGWREMRAPLAAKGAA